MDGARRAASFALSCTFAETIQGAAIPACPIPGTPDDVPTSDLRALLLTDLGDSMKLSQRPGDAEMARPWAAHDRAARGRRRGQGDRGTRDFGPTALFTTPVAGHVVRFAGIVAGETVLDIGTGVLAITAARLGAKVFGLDLTPELIEQARENAAIARLPDIVWKQGDAEELPYPDASFDVVVSSATCSPRVPRSPSPRCGAC